MTQEQQKSKKIGVAEEFSVQQDMEDSKPKGRAVFEPEGELAVDVYQTDKTVVIQSAIAGVRPEELDISIENDMVTIRGRRKNQNEADQKEYFRQECFWGPFSRQIILPAKVDFGNIESIMKDGILTLRFPKTEEEKTKKVKVKKMPSATQKTAS